MKLASGLGLGLITFLLGAVVACSSDEEATPDASSSGGGTSSSSSGESSSGGGSSSTGSSSSSGGSSGTGSSSGAVDAGLQAVVTDVVLTQDAPCTLDLTVPGVDTPSDAADAKILAAIPREVGSYCDAGETMSYDGGYEVKANEWGVLSMALSQSVLYEGMARPTHLVLGHNFDIATGDELALESVLDAGGIAKLRAACITKLTAEDYDAEQAGEVCDSSLESFEGEGGGNIQIEKTGLRLYLDLPNGAFPIALEGAFVAWAELGTSVTLPLVQNFVSKQ